METIEKSVEILNDLIEINNDRIAGFTHAGQELDINDDDLRILFSALKDQSDNNILELSTTINQIGGEPEIRLSNTGTVHRAWLDFKASFSGHDRKTILDECEQGEDAIKKAYKKALDEDNGLSPDFAEIVLRQQEGIIAAHDQIKALRDSQA